jgi:hypothetical protein
VEYFSLANTTNAAEQTDNQTAGDEQYFYFKSIYVIETTGSRGELSSDWIV